MPSPTEIDLLCEAAREHMQRREFPQAQAAYQQVLEINDLDLRAHEGLATIGFLTNDYSLSEKHFKRISQIDVRRSDALVNLGAVYNRKQEFASAAKTLQQAISRNRKSAEAFYNLGIAYKGLNQLSMAISAYREAIRLSPQMAEAYQNLGNVYTEMGNLQQAILNFKRALEINPAFDKARRGLAAAQTESEKQSQVSTPFGRLVDVSTMERKGEETQRSREMTEEERQSDRMTVLRAATAFEKTGETLLLQLREQLSPALLGVSHAFAQEDAAQMHTAFEALDGAVSAFRSCASALMRCGDEMQAHEESVTQSLLPKT